MAFQLFALALLLTVFQAQGNSCTYINLTDRGQSYHNVPTYDQEGSQLCFAYTAAQMIEGLRTSEGHSYTQNESIGPLSVALSYALSRGETDLQSGGIACRAVDLFGEIGACPANKTFRSITEMEELIAGFNECRLKNSSSHCSQIKYRLGPKAFSEILSQHNPLVYVKAIEDLQCSPQERIRLSLPRCDYINDESRPSSEFRARVDEAFNSSRPLPVEIGFSMKIFNYDGVAKKAYRIERRVEPDGFVFSIKYKPHSSILLGRRMGPNGKCQYLLRNTQSSSFCPGGIAKSFGWECTKEGIWMNHQELFESTFQVSRFALD